MVDLVVPVRQHTYKIPQQLPEGSFRTYDIRGEAGDHGLTDDVAYSIGLAVGTMAAHQGVDTVIVGRDGRLSGPALKAALVVGIRETGCAVIDVGIVSTPILYFATNRLNTNTGVMVTASHNPRDHNGFKIVMNGKTLSTQGVQDILSLIQSRAFVQGEGAYSEASVVDDYVDYIQSHVQLDRPLKVVVDCGNGAGAIAGPTLYKAMGCEVVELYCALDGHFPNHHPDPSVPENIQDIIAKVKATQADVGLAFDGDADRLGVITDQGDVIWPDRQVMLFAQSVLKSHPGADIVFDVKCTNGLPKVISEAGGRPVMYKTGHSLLKSKMLEINAPLAGEMSGHIFFNDDWFGFDDGVYAGARLLQILSQQSDSLSQLFARLPNSVNTPELKLPMADADKSAFMDALINQADFGDAQRITIDGLRVDFGDGWGLVRPSNTSPYLVCRFEADSAARLEAIQAIFREQLLAIRDDITLPF